MKKRNSNLYFSALAIAVLIVASCYNDQAWSSDINPGMRSSSAPDSDQCGSALVTDVGSAETSGILSSSTESRFSDRESTVHVLTYRPAEVNRNRKVGTSVVVEYSLSGWEEIQYVAIGWVNQHGVFVHVKNTHPLQSSKIREIIAVDDPILVRNTGIGDRSEEIVARIKLFVKGKPSAEGANLSLHDAQVNYSKLCDRPFDETEFYQTISQIDDGVWENILGYQRSFKDDATINAEKNAFEDVLALSEVPVVPWPDKSDSPQGELLSTTHRYLWQSLDTVSTALVSLNHQNRKRYLEYAEDTYLLWRRKNIEQETDDPKYLWYDHGTALRALALLSLARHHENLGSETKTKLYEDIMLHLQLLGSDYFYNYNQPSRWHNHGMFQDTSLFLISDALGLEAVSNFALDRLLKQFDALSTTDTISGKIVRSNLENSWGYQLGMRKTCEDVAGVIREISRNAEIEQVCQGFREFENTLRYPDGRGPRYGDSFFKPNSETFASLVLEQVERGTSFGKNGGFAAFRGNLDGAPYQLTFIGQNQTTIHKHADNLSFSFWANGIEWLSDLGFYSHHYNEAVERYARGPEAHNILVLEGDYNIGPDTTEMRALNCSPCIGEGVRGTSSSYHGAFITREIIHKSESVFEFLDDVEFGPNYRGQPLAASLHFHTGEGVIAEILGAVIKLTNPWNTDSVTLRFSDKVTCQKVVSPETKTYGHSYPGFMETANITSFRCRMTTETVRWSLNYERT